MYRGGGDGDCVRVHKKGKRLEGEGNIKHVKEEEETEKLKITRTDRNNERAGRKEEKKGRRGAKRSEDGAKFAGKSPGGWRERNRD